MPVEESITKQNPEQLLNQAVEMYRSHRSFCVLVAVCKPGSSEIVQTELARHIDDNIYLLLQSKQIGIGFPSHAERRTVHPVSFTDHIRSLKPIKLEAFLSLVQL